MAWLDPVQSKEKSFPAGKGVRLQPARLRVRIPPCALIIMKGKAKPNIVKRNGKEILKVAPGYEIELDSPEELRRISDRFAKESESRTRKIFASLGWTLEDANKFIVKMDKLAKRKKNER
jgi:hypothetical protein